MHQPPPPPAIVAPAEPSGSVRVWWVMLDHGAIYPTDQHCVESDRMVPIYEKWPVPAGLPDPTGRVER